MDDPNIQYKSFTPSTQPPKRSFRFYLIGGALLVTIIALVGIELRAAHQKQVANQFRLISTTPDTAKFATITPFFRVTFNKPLNRDSLKTTSNPSIIVSSDVDNQSVVLRLTSYNKYLDPKKTYTITVSVSDTAGDHINKTFSFKPQTLALKQLPQDEQQATLQWLQAETPPSKDNVTFNSTDALTDAGISSAQIDAMEQAFYQFAPTAQEVSVNPSSVVQAPVDPNSDNSTLTMNFLVAIDNKIYSARLDYTDITAVRLYLYDGGKLVFDSQTVDTVDTPNGDD